MNCDEMRNTLTLAINALRDIAESKRMPSGLPVTGAIAELHAEAAGTLEELRVTIQLQDQKKIESPNTLADFFASAKIEGLEIKRLPGRMRDVDL